MVIIVERTDPARRFKSTVNSWPLEKNRLIRIPFRNIERNFYLPRKFVTKFGHEMSDVVYTIDDEDNALEILLTKQNWDLFIDIHDIRWLKHFYYIEKDMYIILRYVGFGMFYLSLFDGDNNKLELHPDYEPYVAFVLLDDHLNFVENEFGLKYVFLDDEDSDVDKSQLSYYLLKILMKMTFLTDILNGGSLRCTLILLC